MNGGVATVDVWPTHAETLVALRWSISRTGFGELERESEGLTPLNAHQSSTTTGGSGPKLGWSPLADAQFSLNGQPQYLAPRPTSYASWA